MGTTKFQQTPPQKKENLEPPGCMLHQLIGCKFVYALAVFFVIFGVGEW